MKYPKKTKAMGMGVSGGAIMGMGVSGGASKIGLTSNAVVREEKKIRIWFDFQK